MKKFSSNSEDADLNQDDIDDDTEPEKMIADEET